MSACPSPDQLERLLAEQLAATEQAEVEAHLESCGTCQHLLDQLTPPVPNLSSCHSPHTSESSTELEFLDQMAATLLRAAVAHEQQTQPATNSWPQVPGYVIEDVLGRGGMAVVYKARQVRLKRRVALKVLTAGGHAGPQQRERFQRETELVARLKHPHIVQVYEVGEYDGLPYCALEFVDGGSLAEHLRGQPQPAAVVAALAETLARAVAAAHQQGIIHRDLKPANILLQRLSTRDAKGAQGSQGDASIGPCAPFASLVDDFLPKIADFGLAKHLEEPNLQTQSGMLLGTPSYMAPEQAAGQGAEVGPAADVYALGTLLYELLTGRPPFRGPTALDTLMQVQHEEPVPPGKLQPYLPRDLETICLKCLEKQPHGRYAGALDLAEDLRRFQAGEPIRARPASVVEKAVKWMRRRPRLTVLLGLFACVTAAGFTAVTLLWLRADEERREKEKQSQRAEAARAEAEDYLHFGRLNQALLEWQAGDTARARALLAEGRPTQPGQKDRRHWEWHYLQRLFHGDLFPGLRHDSWVQAVACSPDGRLVASAGGGNPFYATQKRIVPGEVVLWDAHTGAKRQTLRGHPHVISCVAFHPGGRQLATAGNDATVRLWDVASGQEQRVLHGHTDALYSLAFSPDGRRLASAGEDRTVRLWDVATGQELSLPLTLPDVVGSMAFSPDGALLATNHFGDKQRVTLWDVAARTPRQWPAGQEALVFGWPLLPRALAFNPNGRTLASAGQEGIGIHDLATGRLVRTLTGPVARGPSLSFSPDGQWLAAAGTDGTVRVWQVGTGRLHSTFRGHEREVSSVQFDAGGTRLISGGHDGTVKFWDLLRDPHATMLLGSNYEDIAALAFRPDSRQILLACGGQARVVRGLHVTTGQDLLRQPVDLTPEWRTPATLAAFSGDGRLVATKSGGDAHVIKLTVAETGQEIGSLPPHTGPVGFLASSRRANRLASAATVRMPDTKDGTRAEVRVWSFPTPDSPAVTLLCEFHLDDQFPSGLALSPDGQRLAVATGHRAPQGSPSRGGATTVRLFDVASRAELLVLDAQQDLMTGLGFSADGRRLAAAGFHRGSLLLCDLTTGETVRSALEANTAGEVDFSPDGERLAVATRYVVKLLDARSGREILTLHPAVLTEGSPGTNARVRFSPDGLRLVAVTGSNVVTAWDGSPTSAETPGGAEEEAVRTFVWHLRRARDAAADKDEFALRFHLRRLEEREAPGAALAAERQRLLDGPR